MSNIPKSLTDSALTIFKILFKTREVSFLMALIGSGGGGGGGGDKVHHHHHHYHHSFLFLKKEATSTDIPKGCMAVMVGPEEEQQRFVIPMVHINHPLFIQLLKEAEKEYGFDHDGLITIPCHVEEFLAVERLIVKEKSAVNDEEQHHHHHHHHHVWCFRD